MLPVLDDVLLPAIVHALQDHTSVAKQEAAVKTLGQVNAAAATVSKMIFWFLLCLLSCLVWLGLAWFCLVWCGFDFVWFKFCDVFVA